MKNCLIFCLLIYVLSSGYAFGQYKDSIAVNPKPNLFSQQERDSIQLWFYDRAIVMGLQGDLRDEFYNIIINHTQRMRNLSSKEKGYTPEEVRNKFEELLKKQNTEIKAILDDKQYAYYLETYDKLLKSIYKRADWN